MEKEDFQIFRNLRSLQSLSAKPYFWASLFAACYFAVLPMADTIALRNLALSAALFVLVVSSRVQPLKSKAAWVVLAWLIYLAVFPLMSSSLSVAFENLLVQWGRGLIAMLVGAGLALTLRERGWAKPLVLGIVSSIPIVVHLGLVALDTFQTGQIPWGSWGRETHHADLGYAAGQTMILAATAYVTESRRGRWLATVLVLACLLSTSIAHSRAGFIFALLGALLVLIPAVMTGSPKRRLYYFGGGIAMVVLGLSMLAVAVKNDPRWTTMQSELAAGFYGDALDLQCHGTASIVDSIARDFGDQAPRILTSMEGGDAARIVVLRAGLQLAVKHPWGWDGSRQSFQKMLEEECPAPVIRMAHTHNGWLDTVLAIGWAGALMYLLVLCTFLVYGILALRRSGLRNPWGCVLLALSLFWILRGLTDSVYRDHMLEMQGFLLAFALVRSEALRE